MKLVTSKELFNHTAKADLADQISRIDQTMTTKVQGDFLVFHDAARQIVGVVDGKQFSGAINYARPESHLSGISAVAFEAVAARMWRNMQMRAIEAYQSAQSPAQGQKVSMSI